MDLPASIVRHCPMASKFSMAKPIGSMRAWQLAQGPVRAMQAHRLAHRELLAGFGVSTS